MLIIYYLFIRSDFLFYLLLFVSVYFRENFSLRKTIERAVFTFCFFFVFISFLFDEMHRSGPGMRCICLLFSCAMDVLSRKNISSCRHIKISVKAWSLTAIMCCFGNYCHERNRWIGVWIRKWIYRCNELVNFRRLKKRTPD